MGRMAAGLVLGLSLLCVGTAQAAMTSAQVIDAVNAERTANGIPTLAHDAAEASGCAAHTNYGAVNNGWGSNPHDEVPGQPGYSAAGDDAAHHSVLFWGTNSTFANGNPFASAPYHNHQLMDPSLVKSGASEQTDSDTPITYGCVWSHTIDASGNFVVRPNPPTQRVYSHPAHNRTNVPWFEYTAEGPTIPAYDLGLTSDPDGPFLSGKNLLTWWEGPGTKLTKLCDVLLRRPGGQAVTAPFTDDGIIVPRDPMIPNAKYQATVTYSTARPCAATKYSQTFAFITALRRPAEQYLHIDDAYWSNGHLLAPVLQDDPLRRGTGVVTAKFGNGSETSYPQYWGGIYWYLESLPTGATATFTERNDTYTVGSVCWSPTKISRTFTRTASGATAGPTTVTPPSPDACGAKPTVTSFSPATGITGSAVTINGTGLRNTTVVRFGAIGATEYQVLSDTQVRAKVPATAPDDGRITINTSNGTGTSAGSFATTFALRSFAPAAGGPRGTVVTLSGTGFTPTTAVEFNGTPASKTYVNATTLRAVVPSAATSGVIRATNSAAPVGTVQSPTRFTVTPFVAPTISSFTPASGPAGTTVTINGKAFSGASAVRFNGAAAPFTIVNAAKITATVPAGATTGRISVTTSAGTAQSATNFTKT